jgi:hypothetical protein
MEVARTRHPVIRTTAQLIVGIPRTPVIPRGWGIRGGISLSRISPGWRGWWSIVIANIRRCWRWGGWGGACRETNQQSRDLCLQSFIVVRKRSLRKWVSNRAILGYQVYCRRRVTLTRFLILCLETTLARNSCRIRVFSCKATRSLELPKMLVERRS